MGFISRRVLPACTNMCVCCPALRSSSRHPVKRYKKLLADIFPKSADCRPNERKIVKLCEYAAKNPIRIPKIAKYLEQRCLKDLRSVQTKYITISLDAYSKLLCMCKDQMAYFALSLLNVISELLDEGKQDNVHILGCQTLTKFVYNQVDGTYTHNIVKLAPKVCALARKNESEDAKQSVRAYSLQCLSSMIWFMEEFSHIFSDLDEILCVTLDNYGVGSCEDEDRADNIHNWVDEVVKCEGRVGASAVNDVSLSYMALRSRPEIRDPSMLTREEIETPEIWAQICVQKVVALAKESTTMRQVLDFMFPYFDAGKHWDARHGLALHVLSDMSCFLECPANVQLILSSIIRHLDHKNVSNDPHMKSDIIRIASVIAQRLRLQAIVIDVVVVSDLFKHLRKSLEATARVADNPELNSNATLQNSVEGCLMEIAKWAGNVRSLLDTMGIALEKLPPIGVISRPLIDSLLVLAHIISVACASSCPQQVFPESLLLHLIKTMLHPDIEARIGAHYIFATLLNSPADHSIERNIFERRKWKTESASTIASATALLEKLRREKESTGADKNVLDVKYGKNEVSAEDERRHVRATKRSPNFYSSGPGSSPEAGGKILKLTDEQIIQLLSAFWKQAILPDNCPANYESIDHSYNLVLLSSNSKKTKHDVAVRFFQLPLSLRDLSLNSSSLPASIQRSLFTLATSMLLFAAKTYQIPVSAGLPNMLTSVDGDPYLYVGDDMQLHLKAQADLRAYASSMDQDAAHELLMQLKLIIGESKMVVLDIIARSLSQMTQIDLEDLCKQLSEPFVPDDSFLFGIQSITELNWIQMITSSKGSSFDEDSLPSPSIEDDPERTNLYRSRINNDHLKKLTHIVSVGKLLESALEVAGQVAGSTAVNTPLSYSAMANQCEALGVGTRKKLSTWLRTDMKLENHLPMLTSDSQSAIPKVYCGEINEGNTAQSGSWMALMLPPASPFDNFLKAAGC